MNGVSQLRCQYLWRKTFCLYCVDSGWGDLAQPQLDFLDQIILSGQKADEQNVYVACSISLSTCP
ncbi:hypothetical protein SAMN05216224_12219 [Thioclava dalianensis]|nr:hypothetical protein SAMN05216224_12219 [Thioclava dalianensis]